jgi:hypothetical protein
MGCENAAAGRSEKARRGSNVVRVKYFINPQRVEFFVRVRPGEDSHLDRTGVLGFLPGPR